MNKQLIIYILLCFSGTSNIHAQWTEKDSLWLQGILSGKDSIRLNPETMKAIQSGSFLNMDPQTSPMLNSPMELPILKDFSEYIDSSDSTRKVALKDLPPPVLLRHPIAYKETSRHKVNPDFFKYVFGHWSYFQAEKHTGAMRDYDANNGAKADFNHVLSKLFSSEYRQFAKNRENAQKLKSYNDPSSLEIEKKRQKYLKDQRALPTPSVSRKQIIIMQKDTMQKDTVDSLRENIQLSIFEIDTTKLHIINPDSLLLQMYPN